MKTLKNLDLSNAKELTKPEMKNITGGSGANECSGLPSDKCIKSTICTTSDGYPGHCGWVGAWNACACVTGNGGNLEYEKEIRD